MPKILKAIGIPSLIPLLGLISFVASAADAPIASPATPAKVSDAKADMKVSVKTADTTKTPSSGDDYKPSDAVKVLADTPIFKKVSDVDKPAGSQTAVAAKADAEQEVIEAKKELDIAKKSEVDTAVDVKLATKETLVKKTNIAKEAVEQEAAAELAMSAAEKKVADAVAVADKASADREALEAGKTLDIAKKAEIDAEVDLKLATKATLADKTTASVKAMKENAAAELAKISADKKAADTDAIAEKASSPTIYCAGTGSRFIVDSVVTSQIVTVPPDTKAKADSASGETQLIIPKGADAAPAIVTMGTASKKTFYVHFPIAEEYSDLNPGHWILSIFKDVNDPSGKPPDAACITSVTGGVEYVVEQSDLDKYPKNRAGFTWGAVTVPYKFEFKDRSFVSVPSVLGYVGWEGWTAGTSLATIIGTGPGVATDSTEKSAPSSGSKVTYTVAGGEIATFGGVYKAGIMAGYDWQGHASNFKYEGKPWLAISIGVGWN